MTTQLVKKNIDQYIQDLPLEVQNIIFYFIPTMGTAKIMRNVINIYERDRKYINGSNLYYIKFTLSFIEYIYDSNNFPHNLAYSLGPKKYNEGKLININFINNED